MIRRAASGRSELFVQPVKRALATSRAPRSNARRNSTAPRAARSTAAIRSASPALGGRQRGLDAEAFTLRRAEERCRGDGGTRRQSARETLKGQGEGAGLREGAGDGETPQVEGERLVGAGPQLGEEAEFGQAQVLARGRRRLGQPVAQPRQVVFRRGEVARTPRTEGQAHLGVDLGVRVPLLGGDPAGLLVQGAGAVPVAIQQGEPAEPGQAGGHLGQEAQVAGDAQPVLLQPFGLLVRTLDLGERGEGRHGLQLAPSVAQFAEEPGAVMPVAADAREVTPVEREPGPQAERGSCPPRVAEGLEQVLLDDTPGEAARRLARLGDLAGTPLTSDAEIFAGTPDELADLLLDRRSAGLDGFRLRPAVLPHDLRAVARRLVPALQRRGAFRTAYTSDTLRGHLVLTRPRSRYAGTRSGQPPVRTSS